MIKTWQKSMLLIFSFLSTLALNFNLENSVIKYSTNGIQESGRNIVSVVLFLCLYHFYKKVYLEIRKEKVTRRQVIGTVLPAMLFATFMILGYSYAKLGNWSLVFTGKIDQLFTAVVFWCGYFSLFVAGILWLFRWMDKLEIEGGRTKVSFPLIRCYCNWLEKRPFLTAFLTMVIVYIPYMIASYPAIFMGDTPTQILQGYNLPQGCPDYMVPIAEGNYWNNHHPVVHTLLIHICIRLGVGIFSSYNVGIFIYALLQTFSLMVAVALLIKTLVEKDFSTKISLLVLLYFMISPWVQNFMFLVTKDIFYSILMVLFTVLLLRLATEEFTPKTGVLLTLVSFGLIVFRNDGKYVVLLSLIGCFVLLKHLRKKIGLIAIVTLVFSVLLTGVLFPLLQITPGSKREMLSIPFQQTARYLRDAGDEVTEEERAAISAVLDYEEIQQYYYPEISDTVKATYNEDATSEELIAYFKVWFQMLLKHPGIYIQATMNNVYSYFYPEYYGWATGAPHYDSYEWSSAVMDIGNALNEELPTDFHYPTALNSFRNQYEALRETFASLPVVSLLVTPAFYTWVLILWFFYCVRKKYGKGFLCMIPLLLVLLVCVASPVNGWYVRYFYPIALCMPGVLCGGLYMIKSQKSTEQECSEMK